VTQAVNRDIFTVFQIDWDLQMIVTVSPTLEQPDAFLRLWDQQKLTPTLARHLLKLGFNAADKARIHELSAKNQGGTIAADEQRELDNFLRASMTLSVLQSRARRFLRAAATGRERE
jgi:hypothetical protein